MREDLFDGKPRDHSAGDAIDWLRLIRSRRVGPTTFWRLLEEHGTVAAALAALPEVARAAGVADYAPCPEGVARAELRAGHAAGARLVHAGMAAYPRALRDLADAPPVLWTLGDTGVLNQPMVALVGARNASSLGVRMARKLAAGLAGAGYVVVSGLARGIDAAGHEAALTAGVTVAVHAGGIDVIYPPGHGALASDIARSGVRLSETPPGEQPAARHFPMRNRLISGLSRAVVVVEAAARSGSLITARDALDQGREVLVVPGHPLDARAAGCNLLIREGATLVRGVEDVLEVLEGMKDGPADARSPDATAARHGDGDGDGDGDDAVLSARARGRSRQPGGGRASAPAPVGGCGRAGPPEGQQAQARNPGNRRIDRGGETCPAKPRHPPFPERIVTMTGARAEAGAPGSRQPVAAPDRETGRARGPAGRACVGGVPQGAVERDPKKTRALHQQILDRLGPSPLAEDQLIRDLALPAAAVASEIVILELDGRIERHAGGLLSRAQDVLRSG